jgi:hypothetical protein
MIYPSGPTGALLLPVAALAIEAGAFFPAGSTFGYGVRARAQTIDVPKGPSALSLLAEVRLTPQPPMLGDRLTPVLRGGLRVGRVTEGSDERWAFGPHLSAGAALLLEGATIELLAVGTGTFLPFDVGIGVGFGLSAPILEL